MPHAVSEGSLRVEGQPQAASTRPDPQNSRSRHGRGREATDSSHAASSTSVHSAPVHSGPVVAALSTTRASMTGDTARPGQPEADNWSSHSMTVRITASVFKIKKIGFSDTLIQKRCFLDNENRLPLGQLYLYFGQKRTTGAHQCCCFQK